MRVKHSVENGNVNKWIGGEIIFLLFKNEIPKSFHLRTSPIQQQHDTDTDKDIMN